MPLFARTVGLGRCEEGERVEGERVEKGEEWKRVLRIVRVEVCGSITLGKLWKGMGGDSG